LDSRFLSKLLAKLAIMSKVLQFAFRLYQFSRLMPILAVIFILKYIVSIHFNISNSFIPLAADVELGPLFHPLNFRLRLLASNFVSELDLVNLSLSASSKLLEASETQ
jgi:hypothetical protein